MMKNIFKTILICISFFIFHDSLMGQEERAIRPDAPQLGSSLFGPDMACVSTPGCCSSDTTRGCSAIVISETGFPQTLIAPGLYCLATDLTNPLTIFGSSISLDMNGHTIFVPADANGITIANNNVDVRVFNGLINGQGLGGNNGIFVSDATDVRIENVTCIDCDYGIYLAGAGSSSGGINSSPVNTILNYINCRENAFAGLFCQGDFNTAVNDSVFSENGIGILSDESESLVVSRCTLSVNDGTAGFEISGSITTEIRNCVANNNIEEGFLVTGALATIFRNCDASDNGGTGFSITNNSTDASLFDCAAQANIEDGFSVDAASAALIVDSKAMGNVGDGFFFGSPSSVVVRNSDATNNIGFGFNNAVPLNQFYSNVACGNLAGNYNGVVSAPIAGPITADGVDNVDCADGSLAAGCAAIPIYNTNAMQTLSAPGRYCLAEDVTTTVPTDFAVILITGNNIYLDLNGHTIHFPVNVNGIEIDNSSDIHVYNGVIDGDTVGLEGISLFSSSVVTLEDLDVVRTGDQMTGIQAVVCSTLTMRRLNVYNNAAGGIALISGDDVVLSECVIINNVGVGIDLNGYVNAVMSGCTINTTVAGHGLNISNGSSNTLMTDCTFNSNQRFGINTTVAGDLQCVNCTANHNGLGGYNINMITVMTDCVAGYNTGHGFLVSGTAGSQFVNCAAPSNIQDGFHITIPVVVSGCIAEYNGGDGFETTAPSATSIINNCIAKTNNGFGFNNAAAANQFYSNMACDNNGGGANYNGVTSAPIAGPATADGVDNVDCADNALASGCEATPISNTGATQTLSTPGRYCLTENITSAAGNVLTVTASSIWIDLNGHTITVVDNPGAGIGVNAGITDVRIYNGLIDGVTTGQFGISVGAAIDIRIEDITVVNTNRSAIFLSGPTRTIISRAICTGGLNGISTGNDNGTVITDSVCSNNVVNGIVFSTSSVNGVVRSCKANSNSVGFNVSNLAQVELYDCVAENNSTIGFAVNGANALIDHCAAQFNTSHGFDMQAGSVALVQKCSATNNGGRGFNNAVAANQFYSNVACNNVAPNYNGVVSAPIAGPATADGVDNVDCLIPNATCEATPIFNTGATQTLTTSGRYCLTQDITAAANTSVLIISGKSITVDLNGHTILVPTNGTGIAVANTLTDVRISNGLIDGQNNVTTNGITVGTDTDARITDVTCTRCTSTGITLTASLGTMLDHVACSGCGTGIQGSNDIDTMIRDCEATTCTTGMSFGGSTNLWLQRCQSNRNVAGFALANTTRMTLDSCIANGSTGTSGFTMNTCVDFQYLNCISEGNVGGAGFTSNGGNRGTFTGCTAQGNSLNGFSFSAVDSEFVLTNCVAMHNDSGFNTGSPTVYYDCIAAFNQTHGFRAVAASVMYTECVADTNGQGGAGSGFVFFTTSDGTVVNCSSTGNASNGFTVFDTTGTMVFRECDAQLNTGFGFFNAVGANSVFYSNASYLNTGGNYSAGVPAVMIAVSAATAGYWQNVQTAT